MVIRPPDQQDSTTITAQQRKKNKVKTYRYTGLIHKVRSRSTVSVNYPKKQQANICTNIEHNDSFRCSRRAGCADPALRPFVDENACPPCLRPFNRPLLIRQLTSRSSHGEPVPPRSEKVESTAVHGRETVSCFSAVHTEAPAIFA